MLTGIVLVLYHYTLFFSFMSSDLPENCQKSVFFCLLLRISAYWCGFAAFVWFSVLLLASMTVLQAQDMAPPPPTVDTIPPLQSPSNGIKTPPKPYKMKAYGAPLIFKTPETNFGFGVAGGLTFKINKTDTTQRPSNVLLNLDYTLNKQMILEVGYTIFFKHENYQLRLHNSYKKYPDSFWGIGPNTVDSLEERYSYNRWDIYPSFQRRIHDRLFIGLRYRYLGLFSVDWKEGGLYEEADFLGRDGGFMSGIGYMINWDSRDLFFNPSKGFYAHLVNLFYPRWMGGQYNNTHFEIDTRFYWNVVPKYRHVLAMRIFGRFNFGKNVPFFHTALIGGSEVMRGYFNGRFRDKHALTTTLEYRFPIWWRFGAAAFIAAGDVAPTIKAFNLRSLKYSVGGGLRFMIDKRERINVRLDVGHGGGNTEFYITASESF